MGFLVSGLAAVSVKTTTRTLAKRSTRKKAPDIVVMLHKVRSCTALHRPCHSALSACLPPSNPLRLLPLPSMPCPCSPAPVPALQANAAVSILNKSAPPPPDPSAPAGTPPTCGDPLTKGTPS